MILFLVCIQDTWLANHVSITVSLWTTPVYYYKLQVKEVLSKPPPKVRKVLPPEDYAKYTKDLALLRTKIEQETRLKVKQ